jgi:hypothetical protein
MPTYTNDINKFRENFFGVRSNRFMVIPSWPTDKTNGQNLLTNTPDKEVTEIYVKAADIPEASIGVITVPWMGRAIKFSGERTYVDWAIQIYESNAPAKDLRKAFEEWMEVMDGRKSHKVSYDITTDWEVWYSDIVGGQKSTSKEFRRGIRLVNCFPVNVGTLSMDYDVADAFAVFPVTIAFDYWEPLGELASTNTASGSGSANTNPPNYVEL